MDVLTRHRELALIGIVDADPLGEVRALLAAFDEFEQRRFNPAQLRDPGGEDGGQWIKGGGVGRRIVDALEKWARGEGSDNPLDGFDREPLRLAAKARGLTVPRGAKPDVIKKLLLDDLREKVRTARDEAAEVGPRIAKFTLQGPKHRDLDVGVRRLPGDKPALFKESESGKMGGLVEKFDSLGAMAQWADDNGEPRLAEWARKEAGGSKPAKKAAAKVAPAKAAKKAASRRVGPWDPGPVFMEGGESGLRERLSTLSVEQLQDMVAEHNMDLAGLAVKWRSRDRLTDLIVTRIGERTTKGHAFRPPPAKAAPVKATPAKPAGNSVSPDDVRAELMAGRPPGMYLVNLDLDLAQWRGLARKLGVPGSAQWKNETDAVSAVDEHFAGLRRERVSRRVATGVDFAGADYWMSQAVENAEGDPALLRQSAANLETIPAARVGMDDETVSWRAARLRAVADHIEAAERPATPAKRVPRPAAPGTFSQVLDRVSAGLREAKSSEEAREVIDREHLTADQLRLLAKDLNVPVVSGSNKDRIRNDIVKVRVEGRLATATIGRLAGLDPAAKAAPPSTPDPEGRGPEGLSSDPAVREVQVENRIRAAYSRVPRQPGGWVKIRDLRDELGEGVNRHELDEVLARMGRERRISLLPEENQKVLTPVDREAAVTVGGTPYHFLLLEDPSPRPLPSSSPDGVTVAQARQAAIDSRRPIADALSEAAELVGNQASQQALTTRADGIAARLTPEQRKALGPLLTAMRSGDPAKIRRALTAAARKQDLTVSGKPGDVVGYSPRIHEAQGTISEGQRVAVVRPGYSMMVDGEEVVLSRPLVVVTDAPLRRRRTATRSEGYDETDEFDDGLEDEEEDDLDEDESDDEDDEADDEEEEEDAERGQVMDSALRARVLLMETRAVGHDVTPGNDELHHYWTRGKGRAKWVASPKPWTTLVALLTEHVGLAKAKVFASRWFIEVFGYAAGSDKNRVAHGHPPRGNRVGPG